MNETLTAAQLAALARLNSPTISNAIEPFNLRPRSQGFMAGDIKCIFPEMGPMAGYAATATISARQPAGPEARGKPYEHWKAILRVPAPRIVVVQDLDEPPCLGSLWGEVNANIHKALGCIGTITDGGVRDLDEVRALGGFHFFAKAVIPSHAYVHIVDTGVPVTVGGLTVRPGDLLHADQHGVVLVPHEIARELVKSNERLAEREAKIIAYCQSSGFTPEGLRDLMARL